MPQENNSQKLNKTMQERIENAERLQAQFEAEGWQRKDATVSYLTANLMLFVTGAPACILPILLFLTVGERSVTDLFPRVFGGRPLFMFLALAVSVPVHEFLHGVGFSFACEQKWKSIRFGFHLASLTPYCHCREAIGIGSYYLALLLPCTVLGLLPAAAAVVTGIPELLGFGILNILLASGDLAIALVLLKYIGKTCRVLDHPNQCGSIVFLR